MDELNRGLDISLKGPDADAALAKFQQQLDEWQLVMPPVEPLVLDFGLGDFRRYGLIEYWVANENEAGYCSKLLFVFDGQTCPTHSHRRKHETFFVVRGRADITCDGETHRMQPGDVLPMPVGREHSFTGVGPALLLETSTPCEIDDNYFRNTDIPIGGNYRPSG